MKRIRRAVVASALMVGLVSGPAMAWVNAGGGLWDYGRFGTNVWSNYYHRTNWHGSTAVGNAVKYSGCRAPALTSYANTYVTWYKPSQAYYSYC